MSQPNPSAAIKRDYQTWLAMTGLVFAYALSCPVQWGGAVQSGVRSQHV